MQFGSLLVVLGGLDKAYFLRNRHGVCSMSEAPLKGNASVKSRKNDTILLLIG